MITAGGSGYSGDYITITSPNDVYIDASTMYNGGTVTIGSGISSTYTINTSDTITLNDTFTVNWGNTEWVDAFPDFERVKKMCEKYPGLKVAFDNFKVFYEMCKDDYDNPTPKK